MNDAPVKLNPETWLDEHGDVLYRYALARVRDPATAEDMVQETLLAAVKASDRFSGKSSVRTWLIGILKHKIVDYIRKASRESSVEDLDPAESLDDATDDYFDKKGRWRTKPADWMTNPRSASEQQEFWGVLQNCLGGLKDRQHSVFTMRELEGLSADEICKSVGITSTNLWVLLYRARMQLRDCLARNWINKTKG